MSAPGPAAGGAPAPRPLAVGKTKQVVAGPRPGTVWLVTNDGLTAGDAAKRADIPDLGRHKTTQAAHVFAVLAAHGVPVAFIAQDGPDRLLCHQAQMVPLEIVVRRHAFGSYLRRHPDAVAPPGARPRRFECPVSELFHKHAVVTPPLVPHPCQMAEGEARDRFLRDGVWADGVYTDPYVERRGATWALHSAKAPIGPQPLLEIAPVLSPDLFATVMAEIALPSFHILERAWAGVSTADGLGLVLADLKLEVGLLADGRPVLADVIDNDSWRLWPGGDPDRQLDKQLFRDGGSLAAVADNYALVTALTAQLGQAARAALDEPAAPGPQRRG